MGLFEQFPYTNYHEKNLQWLMEHVGEYDDQIKALQDKDVELQQEIDDLDIPGAVDTAIDQLKDDGYFTDLVDESVKTLYPVKNREMGILRIGRLLDNFGYQGRDELIGGQSICYDNSKFYSCGRSASGQTIAVWNATGSLLTYKDDYTTLGHANSIAAQGSYLWIADGSAAALHKVNMSTLAYIESIDLSGMYDNCWGADVDEDGKLWILGSDKDTPSICVIAVEDGNGGFTPKCSFTVSNKVRQGFAVKGGFAYVVYNESNMVYKVDLSDGTLITGYYLPTGDGYHPAGEYEDMFKMAGKLYLATCLYYPSVATQYASIGEIFETDIDNVLNKDVIYQYMESQTMPTLLASESYSYEFNPSTQFTTVEEACWIANYFGRAMLGILNIQKHGLVKLVGGVYEITGSSGSRYVKEMYFENVFIEMSQISTDNLTVIGGRLVIRTADVNGVIAVTRSEVHFAHCWFTNTISITSRRSQLEFTDVQALNSAVVVSAPEAQSNRVKIFTRTKSWVLLLSKLAGQSIGFFTIKSAATGMITPIYFNPNDTGAAFNVTVYNSTTYNKFSGLANGSYQLTKTDNTTVTLGNNDVLDGTF